LGRRAKLDGVNAKLRPPQKTGMKRRLGRRTV
jgi:hypothetical protein